MFGAGTSSIFMDLNLGPWASSFRTPERMLHSTSHEGQNRPGFTTDCREVYNISRLEWPTCFKLFTELYGQETDSGWNLGRFKVWATQLEMSLHFTLILQRPISRDSSGQLDSNFSHSCMARRRTVGEILVGSDNYRAIAVGSCMGKSLSFYLGAQTNDHVFTLKAVIDKYTKV